MMQHVGALILIGETLDRARKMGNSATPKVLEYKGELIADLSPAAVIARATEVGVELYDSFDYLYDIHDCIIDGECNSDIAKRQVCAAADSLRALDVGFEPGGIFYDLMKATEDETAKPAPTKADLYSHPDVTRYTITALLRHLAIMCPFSGTARL